MPGAAQDPSTHPLLRNLNAPQREAVCHAHGPLLLLAGAGSGKTTVITRRIAWLIEEEGVHPGSILAMTFTNKAAEEMWERVQRLVSVPAAQMWVSTFHSFCTRILRREGERTPVGRDFVIFDPADQKSLMKQVLAELKLPEKQFHPRKVLEVISDWKNRCLLPEEAQEEAIDAWTSFDPPAKNWPIIANRRMGELPLPTWPIMKRIMLLMGWLPSAPQQLAER